jgi:5-formyltetrahydrofolate cyclo-ligase
VDDAPPATEHDFSVDVIVTPDRLVACWPAPSGLVREHLSAEQIRTIPAVRQRARRESTRGF